MKDAPSSDTARNPAPWRAFRSTLLMMAASVVTVLGSVLLSLHDERQSNQPRIRKPEESVVEMIPTAIVATLPPVTVFPTLQTEPMTTSFESGNVPNEPTSALPDLDATSSLFGTLTPAPNLTAWPCAGFVPLLWRLHTVQEGDTLFSLARRHAVTMDDVITYNCLESTALRIGQRLYLPDAPMTSTPMPSLTPITPSPTISTPSPSLSATITPEATVTSIWLPSATPSVPSLITLTPTVTPTLTFTPAATTPNRPTETPTATPQFTETATSTVIPTLDTTSTPTSAPASTPTPTTNVPPTSEPSQTALPAPTPTTSATPTR